MDTTTDSALSPLDAKRKKHLDALLAIENALARKQYAQEQRDRKAKRKADKTAADEARAARTNMLCEFAGRMPSVVADFALLDEQARIELAREFKALSAQRVVLDAQERGHD